MTEPSCAPPSTRELPGVRADLERLVRIPGIAFDGFDHSHVERVRRGGGRAAARRRPADVADRAGRRAAGGDRPPAGPARRADRAALRAPRRAAGRRPRRCGEPTRSSRSSATAASTAAAPPTTRPASWRTSRRCGRSATTCRSAWSLFIEGEEEFGSDSLEALLAEHRDELAADVIVIADSGNWDIGVPALTTSLRGIVNCFVEVRTLDHAVHSGMFGGAGAGRADRAVPAARHAARRRRRRRGRGPGRAGEARRWTTRRTGSAPRPGCSTASQLIGTGRIVDRIWTKPAIVRARHRRAADRRGAERAGARRPRPRSASGSRPATTRRRRTRRSARTWSSTRRGARRSTVTLEHDGDAVRDRRDRAGVRRGPRRVPRRPGTASTPVDIGVGGSIPFIATFQEMFPEAAILVTGVEDPHARAHGPNESLHLGEFARVCLAEALLLREGRRGRSPVGVASREPSTSRSDVGVCRRVGRSGVIAFRTCVRTMSWSGSTPPSAALGDVDVSACPEDTLNDQLDELVRRTVTARRACSPGSPTRCSPGRSRIEEPVSA